MLAIYRQSEQCRQSMGAFFFSIFLLLTFCFWSYFYMLHVYVYMFTMFDLDSGDQKGFWSYRRIESQRIKSEILQYHGASLARAAVPLLFFFNLPALIFYRFPHFLPGNALDTRTRRAQRAFALILGRFASFGDSQTKLNLHVDYLGPR